MSVSATEDRISLKVEGLSEPIEVPAGSTPLSILQQYKELPQDAVVAKLNHVLKGLQAPLTEGGELKFLTFDDPEGKEVYFHSTTHLMAQAVTELFPNVRLAIGPPIESGYYYDFEVDRPFTPEDLEKIEQRMKERAEEQIPVERFDMNREEALKYYQNLDQKYKCELIEGFDDPSFSFYRQGQFTDMCRGPHVPHTGYLKHFKLLSIAGAYWRGDERNPMLQR